MSRQMRALVLLAGLLLAGQLVAAPPAVAQPPDQPPDVTGQLVPEAKSTLEAWNPKVDVVVIPVGGDFPKGTDPDLAVVVSQALTDPAKLVAVTAPQIALSVTARVPDLANLTQAAAGDLIVRSGLRGLPSPRTAPPDWIVVDQSPPAGTIDKWGGAVEFVLGPPTLVEVPDLSGQSADQARATAAAAKLQVSIEATQSGTRQTPVVIRQDPAPGKRVAPGSTVRIALGAPGVPGGPPSPPPSPAPARFSPTAMILTGGSILLLLALLLLLGLLLTQARRRPRWVREHVRVQVRAADAGTLRLEPAGTGPDITVTIARREAPPEIRVEEIHS